jgi:HAE1 family hydrophobic/amphiphilic exporter-1
VDESTRVGIEITDIVMKKMVGTNGQQEWENIFMRTGQSVTGFATTVGEKEGDHVITAGARLIKRKLRTRSTFDYAEIIRALVAQIPGIMKLDVSAGNPMQMFFGAGKPVQVEVLGANIPLTNQYAYKLQGELRKNVPSLVDITLSRDAGRQNLNLKVNKERASLMGLNTAIIAQQLRTALYGASVSKYRVEEDEYDIFLRVQEADRNSIEKLKQLPIVNLMGKTVPLGNVAEITRGVTPTEIDRLNQERVVKVEANTAKGAKLGDITNAIRSLIKNNPPPTGVTVRLGGDIERMADAFKQLFFVAILGAILVYMVMAAQFENYLDPFIIMFSVPFALVGVFLFVVATRTSFSVYSFLGIIMLLGVVVNNAIVFVDYTNILRRKGMELEEALVLAGKHRLRPILMTTLTTLFGMLPMALSREEGAEFWKPIGISFIGGMTVSTLVTLILIPTIYHLIYKWLLKRGRGIRKEIIIDETKGY